MMISLDEISQLIRLQLGISQVNSEDQFQETLGAESIDLVNIVATIEERYDIEFEEEELAKMQSVGDLHRLAQQHLCDGESDGAGG